MTHTPTPRFTLFAYGFRPFFLGALGFALVSIAAWMVVRGSPTSIATVMPPQLWHGHEMLFGFIGAAIAGFLLTAVPSWTGERGFAGAPLVTLTLLWLAGRIAFSIAGSLPFSVLTFAELLFLPALAALIAPPLLRARNRNTPLLIVILTLWLIDAVFLWAVHRNALGLASRALLVGIDVVLLLITVIGGRIVPAFTASALRREGAPPPVRTRKGVDLATIALMVVLVIVDMRMAGSALAASIAGAAALLHIVRMAGWMNRQIWRRPIVWVLHVAYAGLPVGLALKALHLGAGWDWASQWLHALTIGAASMMIVAVVTRASLGHTGRPLVVSKITASAYGVLLAAALVRISATPLASEREWTLWVAAVLWIVAFGMLLSVYGPVLLRPRVDGKSG